VPEPPLPEKAIKPTFPELEHCKLCTFGTLPVAAVEGIEYKYKYNNVAFLRKYQEVV
jgi:hypothetical protein